MSETCSLIQRVWKQEEENKRTSIHQGRQNYWAINWLLLYGIINNKIILLYYWLLWQAYRDRIKKTAVVASLCPPGWTCRTWVCDSFKTNLKPMTVSRPNVVSDVNWTIFADLLLIVSPHPRKWKANLRKACWPLESTWQFVQGILWPAGAARRGANCSELVKFLRS